MNSKKPAQLFLPMKLNINRTCPLQCGVCCDMYWKNVRAFENCSQATCPHQQEWGCELKRNERPDECVYYLCDIAEAVIDRSITKLEAEGLLEQACHSLLVEDWPIDDL